MRDHRSSRLVAVFGAAALLVAVAGVGASPVLARSTKPKVLLQDPLSKPSKAVRPRSSAKSSWAFVNHEFLGQDLSPGDYHAFYPVFKNQGTIGLANVTIEVQATLLPNTQSTAGVTCRDAGGSSTHFYRADVHSDGTYVVLKDSDTGSQRLASGSVQVQKTNRIRLSCTGPAQPGPTDTVTLTGAINDQTFTTQDSSSAYPGAYLGLLVGTDGQVAGGASFSNLKITQTG